MTTMRHGGSPLHSLGLAALVLLLLAAAAPAQEPEPGCAAGEADPARAACLLQQGSGRRAALPAAHGGPASLTEDASVKDPSTQTDVKTKAWQKHLNEPATYEDAKPRHGGAHAADKGGASDEGSARDLSDVLTSALAALGEQPPRMSLAQVHAGTAKEEQHKQLPPPQASKRAAAVEVAIALPVPVNRLQSPPLGPLDDFLRKFEKMLMEALSLKEGQVKVIGVQDKYTLSFAGADSHAVNATSTVGNASGEVEPYGAAAQDSHAVNATSTVGNASGEVEAYGAAAQAEQNDKEPLVAPKPEPRKPAKDHGEGHPEHVSKGTAPPLAVLVVEFDAKTIQDEQGIVAADVPKSLQKLLADETSMLHKGTIAGALKGAYVADVKMTPLPESESPRGGVVLRCLVLLAALAAALGTAAEER